LNATLYELPRLIWRTGVAFLGALHAQGWRRGDFGDRGRGPDWGGAGWRRAGSNWRTNRRVMGHNASITRQGPWTRARAQGRVFYIIYILQYILRKEGRKEWPGFGRVMVVRVVRGLTCLTGS